MRRWVAHTVVVVLAGTVIVGLAACGGSPGDDPVVKQKFREIDDTLRKVEQLPADFVDIREELDALTDEIMRLRGSRGTTAPVAASADVARQLKGLSDRLRLAEGKILALQNDLKKLQSARPKPTTVSLRTKPPTPKRAAGGTPPKTPAKTPATPAPRPPFIQYTAQKGDTMASVAKKFNITVQDLVEANTYLKFVKPDEELIVGQSYWIPQK